MFAFGFNRHAVSFIYDIGRLNVLQFQYVLALRICTLSNHEYDVDSPLRNDSVAQYFAIQDHFNDKVFLMKACHRFQIN